MIRKFILFIFIILVILGSLLLPEEIALARDQNITNDGFVAIIDKSLVSLDSGESKSKQNEYQTYSPLSDDREISTDFSATPLLGISPLEVQFTDESTNSPTGWAWYFGDEDYSEPWIQVSAEAEWSVRRAYATVILPDGSIVLMGGCDDSTYYNDVWRSTDEGTTWSLMTSSAEWAPRCRHTSVALTDGSILLMAGEDPTVMNDVWRSYDLGATWTQVTAAAEWSARSYTTSVTLSDSSIVLMGGSVNGVYQNDVWRSTDNGNAWTLMTANAEWTARAQFTSNVLSDDTILIMGGSTGVRNNDVWSSDDLGATWTLLTLHAEWSARIFPTSQVMPDGSIILMGGNTGAGLNDVWQSKDHGETWVQITVNAEWPPRMETVSALSPNGDIVLIGGYEKNDIWCWQTAGSNQQNPTHIYTDTGKYSVALQAYNSNGSSIKSKEDYIKVNIFVIFVPMIIN